LLLNEAALAMNTAPTETSSLPPIHIGTCAWTYDDWRGVFYPEHLPAGERLAWYARWFNAVEVDSTFYHAPTPQVASHWAEVAPAGFQFSCKVPREITHKRKLRECTELLADFLSGIEPLEEKLGCLLIQLPPRFTPKHDEHALREFIHHLPRSFPWAIEFRGHEWRYPRIAHLLEEHGVAWVWNDQTSVAEADTAAFEFHPRTADFAVLRLLGDPSTKYLPDGSRVHQYTRLQWPRTGSLDNWVAKIRGDGPHLRRVLVLCSNHFEGFAPLTVQRIAERLGIPQQLPDESELRPREDSDQLELL
jgi:uncharacterized protein YecE (DUF72 family)